MESTFLPLPSNEPNLSNLNDSLCFNFKKVIMGSHRHSLSHSRSNSDNAREESQKIVEKPDLNHESMTDSPKVSRRRPNRLDLFPSRAQTEPPKRSGKSIDIGTPDHELKSHTWDVSSIESFDAFASFDEFEPKSPERKQRHRDEVSSKGSRRRNSRNNERCDKIVCNWAAVSQMDCQMRPPVQGVAKRPSAKWIGK